MVKNYYRLNIFAEKPFFVEETYPDYFGVVINAHLASYMKNATVSFIKTIKKPFFIDPITYIFSQNPTCIRKKGEESIRLSYNSLLPEYGDFINSTVMDRSLKTTDFKNGNNWLDKHIDDFVSKVVSFQLNLIPPLEQDTFSKYLEELDEAQEEISPCCIIPPYFFAHDCNDEWYSISLELAKRTKRAFPDKTIYPVICLHPEILYSEEKIKQVVQDYSEDHLFDGYFIWFSEFNELQASKTQLVALTEFIKMLKERSEKEIISMYGGFFSLLLSKAGLSGFASSISYGEQKPVSQRFTGGRAPIRYYLPFIHKSIPISVVRDFIKDHPEYKCDCEVCEQYPGFPNDNRVSKMHFIKVRKKEISEIEHSSVEQIIEMLNSNLNYLDAINCTLYSYLEKNHIQNWLYVLEYFLTH